MSSALSTLVNNLAKSGPDEFKVTRQAFFKKYPNLVNENNFELLLRKSIFPYEYITNFDVFNDAKLPSKNHFYSSLTFDTVSNDDYNYAQKVWKEFDCKTLGDYHDIYLELDVCLLADVFTKFRKTIYENYQLEAAHFYSVPGLSFSACLKTTKVELELLTDPEMVLLFESGLRGGVTQCSKRYAKANNKYLENYDENDKNSYLLYVDCNSLYGYSMADYMPESEFKWLNDEEIKNFERNIDMYLNSTDVGYVIECNLEYPERLHDFHSDFPLAPEKMKIPTKDLSEYQKNLLEIMKDIKYKRVPTEKLMLTLYDKEKYIVHYQNLKLYLSLGMKLKKIHRILSFKQSKWLKTFIDLNTELRKNSTTEFEIAL
jgi:hypothetical protein